MNPKDFGLDRAAYSISEAAKQLGIGRTAIYELIRSGDLHPVKPCLRKNLILVDEMVALLCKWRATPAKKHLVKRRNAAVLEKKAEEQRASGRELTPEQAELLADLGL